VPLGVLLPAVRLSSFVNLGHVVFLCITSSFMKLRGLCFMYFIGDRRSCTWVTWYTFGVKSVVVLLLFFFSHLHPPFPEVFACLYSIVSIGADPLRVPFMVSLSAGSSSPGPPVSCLVGGSRVLRWIVKYCYHLHYLDQRAQVLSLVGSYVVRRILWLMPHFTLGCQL